MRITASYPFKKAGNYFTFLLKWDIIRVSSRIHSSLKWRIECRAVSQLLGYRRRSRIVAGKPALIFITVYRVIVVAFYTAYLIEIENQFYV